MNKMKIFQLPQILRPIINPTMKLWVKDEVIVGNMWYLQPEAVGLSWNSM
jgi:hypothetical protein